MGAKFGDNSQPSSSHGSLGSKIIKQREWNYTYVLGDGHRSPKKQGQNRLIGRPNRDGSSGPSHPILRGPRDPSSRSEKWGLKDHPLAKVSTEQRGPKSHPTLVSRTFIVPFSHNCSISQCQQGCGSDLHLHHNYLVGLSEHCGCPAPSFSDSADVGWGPRTFISKESQVMLDAGLRPPCHTHWCWVRESRVNFLS